MNTIPTENKRYHLLDGIRGVAILSMVLYHGFWDFISLFEKNWPWFSGAPGYFWQQATCCTFIVLSGVCWKLGKKQALRGAFMLFAGTVITVVTSLFMPSQQVLYGILTFLGSAYLLMIPLNAALRRIPATLGLLIFSTLFIVTKNLNDGYLGLGSRVFAAIPQSLYRGHLANYLGFMEPGFSSADYFSLFPWLFLFVSGYFLWQIAEHSQGRSWFKNCSTILTCKIPLFSFLGRHSLLLYLLHQPILYLMISLWLQMQNI